MPLQGAWSTIPMITILVIILTQQTRSSLSSLMNESLEEINHKPLTNKDYEWTNRIDHEISEEKSTIYDRIIALASPPSLCGPDCLMRPIRTRFPAKLKFGNQATRRAIAHCYQPMMLNGFPIRLFAPNVTIFRVIFDYYQIFAQKRITQDSIESLLQSSRQIAQHVAECAEKLKRYRLGFTVWSDISEQEFRAKIVQFRLHHHQQYRINETKKNRGPQLSSSSIGTKAKTTCYPPKRFVAPERIDWSARGAITGVRNQGYCASCWAFAVVASLESAYLIRHRRSFDLSEQQLVDCAATTDGCKSGTSYDAFRYIFDRTGGMIATERSYPYRAKSSQCMYDAERAAIAPIAGYCVRGANWYGDRLGATSVAYERLSDAAIRRAVAFFGPVTVCLNGDRLQHYRGGIFDDPTCDRRITHMVLLVGYTPDAWILKNSWGTEWGERGGYFRVARHRNMCGINFEIAYPLV